VACSAIAHEHASFTRIGPKIVNSNYVFGLLPNSQLTHDGYDVHVTRVVVLIWWVEWFP
jgi:hypothetical protein